MWTSPPTILLLAALPFITSSFAQNTTTNATCNQIEIEKFANSTFNSTGSVVFHWENQVTDRHAWGKKDWYLSVAVNDTLRGRNTKVPNLVQSHGFLSVPSDVRDLSACLWAWPPQNATSIGDAANQTSSCNGVLSDGCQTYLRSALFNATSGLRPGDSCEATRWPKTEDDAKRRRDACGEGFDAPTPYRRQRWDVSNTTCPYPPPQGVDIPDDYVTRYAWAGGPLDHSLYNFENGTSMYDLMVNQPVPFALSVAFDDPTSNIIIGDISFHCVTPNKTQPGSRVPESRTPWKTSGAASNWKSAGGWSAVVAVVVGVMLTL